MSDLRKLSYWPEVPILARPWVMLEYRLTTAVDS